jgi:hypothetical protein
MKLELLILGSTIFLIYNTYHEGKYLKMIYSYKKYFQMAFLALIGFSLYLLIKRNPAKTKNILLCANNMVKYMPIDKSTMDIVSPIIDFTTAGGGIMNDINGGNVINTGLGRVVGGGNFRNQTINAECSSGTKGTKRSVSETKKKYVASMQNWKCGNCNEQLNHTFEIDHKIRLENNGSNDVENLVALCRNCHGKKTAMENM